jgi:hypothetical protein
MDARLCMSLRSYMLAVIVISGFGRVRRRASTGGANGFETLLLQGEE